jgi:hypothetical protein
MAEAVKERSKWVKEREEELEAEKMRLDGVSEEVEVKVRALDEVVKGSCCFFFPCCLFPECVFAGRKDKGPLEEVKNLLEPLVRMPDTHHQRDQTIPDAKPKLPFPGHETPVMNRNVTKLPPNYQPSAMKGVVFTATGETLATPTPAELTNLFVNSPKVGLNFSKIFDFEVGEGEDGTDREDNSDADGPPPSPSIRDRVKIEPKLTQRDTSAGAPPSRLRRPSVHLSVQCPVLPSSTSDPTGLSAPAPQSKADFKRPSAGTAPIATKRSATVPQSSPGAPEYDFSDEENLPSPFLRRAERETALTSGGPGATLRSQGTHKRPSGGNLLRVVAAANVVNANAGGNAGKGSVKNNLTRPSVTSARKAGEEARKALLRQ